MTAHLVIALVVVIIAARCLTQPAQEQRRACRVPVRLMEILEQLGEATMILHRSARRPRFRCKDGRSLDERRQPSCDPLHHLRGGEELMVARQQIHEQYTACAFVCEC